MVFTKIFLIKISDRRVRNIHNVLCTKFHKSYHTLTSRFNLSNFVVAVVVAVRVRKSMCLYKFVAQLVRRQKNSVQFHHLLFQYPAKSDHFEATVFTYSIHEYLFLCRTRNIDVLKLLFYVVISFHAIRHFPFKTANTKLSFVSFVILSGRQICETFLQERICLEFIIL